MMQKLSDLGVRLYSSEQDSVHILFRMAIQMSSMQIGNSQSSPQSLSD